VTLSDQLLAACLGAVVLGVAVLAIILVINDTRRRRR